MADSMASSLLMSSIPPCPSTRPDRDDENEDEKSSKGKDKRGKGSGEGHGEDKDEKMSVGGSSNVTEDMHSPDEGDEEEEDTSKTPEERMTFALSCKDFGNEAFKKGTIDVAKEKYKEGLGYLKNLDLPDARALRIALNGNMAMCCIKLEEWKPAITAADAVLQEEPENVKALYRRGVARSAYGLYSEARTDLVQVVKLDPKNTDARKELEKLKEKIQKHNSEKKKAFSGLFDRAAGMYDDREEQMRLKRLQAEEEEKKRREEWEKEMAERKEKGEEEISFEKWKEEKEKAEENKEKKKRERGSSSSSPASSTGGSSSGGRSSTKSGSSGSDSLELDEEDQKIIDETKKMGYCYFRRDLTEEEKKINAQHRPTKVDPSRHSTTASSPVPLSEAQQPAFTSTRTSSESPTSGAKQSGVSSWNAAGTTYEEKDMSQWAKKRFEERLRETKVERGGDINSLLSNPQQLMEALKMPTEASSGGGQEAEALASLSRLMNQFMHTEIRCKDVTGLTGDAQVVVMRGTKRYLFEFSCTVVFEVSGKLEMPDSDGFGGALGPRMREDDDATKFCYTGELVLPEVSSAEGKGMAWLTGSRIRMKKTVSQQHKAVVDECIENFKKQLVEQIQHFLTDFSKTS
ncbi:tetratricopeptide repeat-containing protein [Cystoisospora suis]|uniref:peptidylprolyl isomerase n=1 Tax=Cystoisospora suis TaxID=483139 RepID=A0A2C6L2C9_9APIC|nr:tetratricopeptide repeat-containing protein [Cystoisospora suis]